MQPTVTITIIQHGSEAYVQMLHLRTIVLLQPIGIDPAFIKPEQEQNDVLIGAFEKEHVIGCCVLTPRSTTTIKLRQMAVALAWQGKSIGAAIVQFAEQWTRENGYQTLMLHARSTVVEFYHKSGYTVTGEMFEEVGIPHYRMEKQL